MQNSSFVMQNSYTSATIPANGNLQKSSFLMQHSSFVMHNFLVFSTQFLVLNTTFIIIIIIIIYSHTDAVGTVPCKLSHIRKQSLRNIPGKSTKRPVYKVMNFASK